MGEEEIKCIPCSEGGKAIDESTAAEKLAALPGWQLSSDKKSIIRSVKLKNWKQSFALVGRIDKVAEREQHHPDIAFGWGYCTITLTTHKINGLHENDFIMAKEIEALIEEK